MRTLSACLIIKDENEYIEEWLDWHFAAGVEYFYIYDNGSKVPVSSSIPERYRERCTVQAFPGTQEEAYTSCLTDYGRESRWMAFIDTDEFIRVVDGGSIPAFLATLPATADAVALRWVIYGADGQREKRREPVRTRFLRKICMETCNIQHLPHNKCIVRTSSVRAMAAHGPIQTEGAPLQLVNERGKPLWGIFDPDLTGERVVVDHYFTRSLEEWQEKMVRGSCDPTSRRDPSMFWVINPDMKEERA